MGLVSTPPDCVTFNLLAQKSVLASDANHGSHLLCLCSVQGPLPGRELSRNGKAPCLLNTRKHFTLILQTTWV